MYTITSTQFTKRAIKAYKARSVRQAGNLINDVLKFHFARYLVVDANSTFQLNWTENGAKSWIKFCAPALVRVIDTWDNSIVFERRQENAYKVA